MSVNPCGLTQEEDRVHQLNESISRLTDPAKRLLMTSLVSLVSYVIMRVLFPDSGERRLSFFSPLPSSYHSQKTASVIQG